MAVAAYPLPWALRSPRVTIIQDQWTTTSLGGGGDRKAASLRHMAQRSAVFASERLRPARDLLKRIPKFRVTVPEIIDVGCRAGESSKLLLEQFPHAKLLCLDKSAAQLDAAKADELLSNRMYVSFAHEDVSDHFCPSEAARGAPLYDLIFSNAALHWSDAPLPELTKRLLGRVRPGGALAVQIPDMAAQPSHALFQQTAQEMGLDTGAIRLPTNEASPTEYADALLGPLCKDVDMWSTTYVHTLSGPDAVFHFMRQTFDGRQALTASFGAGDEGASVARAFEEAYRAQVTRAYPPQKNGSTLYPVTRFFLVAERPLIFDC